MRFWQWAVGQMTFGQLPGIPAPSGEHSTGSSRRPNPVVGGYYADRPGDVIRQTSGSLAGGGTYQGQNFDPYRDRDLRRILGRLVNQGGIYDLQLALVQAGLLDDQDVAFGYLDDDTSDAFSTILGIANQNGLDWRDVLSQASAGGGIGGNTGYGTGSGPAPLSPTVVQLPNRDDTIAAAEATGMSLSGHRLDDDLTQSIADHVLDTLRTQQERQVQAELASQGTGQGVMFTNAAPDPQRLLEEEVRRRAPNAVADKGARDASDLWFSLVNGPVG